jgi:hypothetical protein
MVISFSRFVFFNERGAYRGLRQGGARAKSEGGSNVRAKDGVGAEERVREAQERGLLYRLGAAGDHGGEQGVVGGERDSMRGTPTS